ncbi:acyltransferase [Flavobacterium sp.]|uniref:acyltransferase family protein n=1 Tax=Flavobacterium sp. TaxID=239 RepID=UPI0025BCD0B4|nr:acyltransferase [Flavobacterium sp.]
MVDKKINYYPSLNGLRAVSIIIVLFNHISLHYDFFPKSFRFLPLLLDGQFGVNVFFVISGFLITSLLLNEQQKTGTVSLKNFFIRRTLRIFPAYYFLLLVYFILEFFHFISIPSNSWLTAITYTKYFNWRDDWYTSHAWSLSVEEHFYLFWPFIFILGFFVRKISAFIIISLVPIARIYFHYHPEPWYNDLTIFFRIDSIVIGCICALYKEQLLNLFHKHWTSLFYGAIAVLILLFFGPLINRKLDLGIEVILRSIGGTYGTLANISIALIMMYSIYGPQGLWFNFLNLPVINYIGVLSYSLYLWQQFFLSKSSLWINQLPQNLVLIVICALASYYIIEKPFFKIKDKFSTQSKVS